MPWTDVIYLEEINRFVILARSGRLSVTELRAQFGISRNTGYKHLEYYAALGLAGLQPRRLPSTLSIETFSGARKVQLMQSPIRPTTPRFNTDITLNYPKTARLS